MQIWNKINTPAKVQDYINAIPFNFEKGGETLRSPHEVMKKNKAHCLEGALLASAILSHHKIKNYLLDLKTRARAGDMDHVECVFKIGKYFGAISKTNHAVLRYREPVYKNARELAMSYYHEYFLYDGTKTLDSFSSLMPTSILKTGWQTSEENLWYIVKILNSLPHTKIVPEYLANKLRKADEIEIKAGKLIEFKK